MVGAQSANTSKVHRETMRIAVLGGGLTGLALGYLLNQKRVNFEILEKEKECGGLMRTLQEDGFTFDYGGSHVIFSKNKEVLDFMLKLLKNNKIKNRRNTKVLYKRHYVKYPFENGLADLPIQDNFECLYYFIQNLITKEKGELKRPNNLKEWFYYTFGKGIAEKYLIPYNEKIWKYPLEKTSLEWVERVPNPPIEDIVKSSLGIETEGYMHQLYFYYPRIDGIQALIKSLERKIEDHIIPNFEVKKIEKDNGKWIISDEEREKSYDKIISTIPVQNLIETMDATKEVINAANNLKYNSLISVMLGLNVPNINALSWLYIPDERTLSHKVGFPSNYSPNVAPAGKSSVLAEVTCNIGSKIWKMKDEEILDRVINDLHDLKIINKADVCFVTVRRTEYAYVIIDLDYDKNMKIVKDYMSKTGIDLAGRFSEFKYLNMDACIKRVMDYVKEKFARQDPTFCT
ncbi:FAD-dependent oxidoreductase [Candidatus Bathyarchaeota archaeon]|nr:FAD-dependent oxidoreductase [Candidatus Bathyarchaeota archaeon]